MKTKSNSKISGQSLFGVAVLSVVLGIVLSLPGYIWMSGLFIGLDVILVSVAVFRSRHLTIW